jgi:hypothetical protein
MLALIDSALRAARPGITVQHAENPADALRAALQLAGGGPVLFLYEKLAFARDALAAVGAQPWPEAGAASPASEAAADSGDTGRGSRSGSRSGSGSRSAGGSGGEGSEAGRAAASVAVAAPAAVVDGAARVAGQPADPRGACPTSRDGSADYGTPLTTGRR